MLLRQLRGAILYRRWERPDEAEGEDAAHRCNRTGRGDAAQRLPPHSSAAARKVCSIVQRSTLIVFARLMQAQVARAQSPLRLIAALILVIIITIIT